MHLRRLGGRADGSALELDAQKSLAVDLDQSVSAFDSTTVDLCVFGVVAIAKKQLQIPQGMGEILRILSIGVFGKPLFCRGF